jgi:hypothetical protein
MNIVRLKRKRGTVLIEAVDYEKIKLEGWNIAPRLTGRDRLQVILQRGQHRDGNYENVILSRYLLNPPKGILVDHWDGNTLNNVRSNLRPASDSQNQANRKKKKGCSSKFKGVSATKNGRWIAYITVNYTRIWLGSYDLECDAASAYDSAARKYFKGFANTNF